MTNTFNRFKNLSPTQRCALLVLLRNSDTGVNVNERTDAAEQRATHVGLATSTEVTNRDLLSLQNHHLIDVRHEAGCPWLIRVRPSELASKLADALLAEALYDL